MAKITNSQMWEMCRRLSPSFATHTSKGTNELFSEKGFESLTRTDISSLNEFFELSLRIALNKINIADSFNPIRDKGLVEVYDMPEGAYAQRMAINSIKPVSPAYKKLIEGQSVDPFIVRKPDVSERFFGMNFDYQSFITLQDFQVKQIFVSPYGMDNFIGGIMSGLQSGYITQEYLNTKEALNKAINSNKYPIQDSQNLKLDSWTGASPTDTEIRALIKLIKDVKTQMEVTSQTTAFNAYKFNTRAIPSEHVLILRAGILNLMETETLYGAFNRDDLAIPFDIIEVDNFGGLEYYRESAFTTRLYPAYNSLGEQIGFNTTQGSSTASVQNDNAFVKDPNSNVVGIIAQKGLVFEVTQNGYTVTPILNPRGMYTNYWANRPNTGINIDPLYNMIVISTQ